MTEYDASEIIREIRALREDVDKIKDDIFYYRLEREQAVRRRKHPTDPISKMEAKINEIIDVINDSPYISKL